MPTLDGHGTLKALKENPDTAQIPFIFLTARGEENDIRSGMNNGADDYLVKPFEAADLLAGQLADLAPLQPAQRDRAEDLAPELGDRVAELLEHAADQAVAAFRDAELQPGSRYVFAFTDRRVARP